MSGPYRTYTLYESVNRRCLLFVYYKPAAVEVFVVEVGILEDSHCAGGVILKDGDCAVVVVHAPAP